MSEYSDYDEAVQITKTAILQSQYDAARSVNEKQLMLYYNIGKYISLNSRNGTGEKERLTPSVCGLTGNCQDFVDFLSEA